eukprot:Opistho-2@44239
MSKGKERRESTGSRGKAGGGDHAGVTAAVSAADSGHAVCAKHAGSGGKGRRKGSVHKGDDDGCASDDYLDDDLEDGDGAWESWTETDPHNITCLFCTAVCDGADAVFDHMKSAHNVFLVETCREWGLDIYQRIKMVNFLRRKVFESTCPACAIPFLDRDLLLSHMSPLSHYLPERSSDTWNQAE